MQRLQPVLVQMHRVFRPQPSLRYYYCILSIIASLTGLILCFWGPYSFFPQRQLLLPRVFAAGLDREEVQDFQHAVLADLTQNTRYHLVTPVMFQDLVVTRGLEHEIGTIEDANIDTIADIANRFGVSHVLTVVVTRGGRPANPDTSHEASCRVSLTIRETGRNLPIVTVRAAATCNRPGCREPYAI